MPNHGEGAKDGIARWLAVSGAALSIVLSAALSHWSATHIFEKSDLLQLLRTFDEVTADYSVTCAGAWLDVVERGFPRNGPIGAEKSPRQIDFETRAYARYRLLKSNIDSRCAERDDMRQQLSALECANYRVYALYDATEDGASTVQAEAEKDRERLGQMRASCAGIPSLLSIDTSPAGRDLTALKNQYAKEHRALLEAIAGTRKLLLEACD